MQLNREHRVALMYTAPAHIDSQQCTFLTCKSRPTPRICRFLGSNERVCSQMCGPTKQTGPASSCLPTFRTNAGESTTFLMCTKLRLCRSDDGCDVDQRRCRHQHYHHPRHSADVGSARTRAHLVRERERYYPQKLSTQIRSYARKPLNGAKCLSSRGRAEGNNA